MLGGGHHFDSGGGPAAVHLVILVATCMGSPFLSSPLTELCMGRARASLELGGVMPHKRKGTQGEVGWGSSL